MRRVLSSVSRKWRASRGKRRFLVYAATPLLYVVFRAVFGAHVAAEVGAPAMIVLVLVTAKYAVSTGRMAKETEHMAKATERTAAETARMATEEAVRRGEGAKVTLLYLAQESRRNAEILREYLPEGAEKRPVLRFLTAGARQLAEVLPWVGDQREPLFNAYAALERVNARIDEFFANPRCAADRGDPRLAIFDEARKLHKAHRLPSDLEDIAKNLEEKAGAI